MSIADVFAVIGSLLPWYLLGAFVALVVTRAIDRLTRQRRRVGFQRAYFVWWTLGYPVVILAAVVGNFAVGCFWIFMWVAEHCSSGIVYVVNRILPANET